MKPWKIMSTGIRTKDVRGNPIINPWSNIKDFFPAQLELGCGPSIEANIPPLNYLHEVYCVTDPKTGEFIFDNHRDKLVANLINDPNKLLILLSEMCRRCFMAEPTYFHRTIKEMYDRGFIVGPIITNNFDGLPNRLGLGEIFVRRYEESNITPKIKFHPKAKSLFVVGSHADRRRIQHAARQNGLIVAYVDPEGYSSKGQFEKYHLESPQDNDMLFSVTAEQFAKKINKLVL